MKKMSILEYAKHHKCHENKIRGMIKDGHIPAEAVTQGKYRKIFIDPKIADKNLQQNVAFRRRDLMKEISKKTGTDNLSYSESRTLTQRYKASLLKIQLDKETGRLVDADDVRKAAFDKGRAVRDSLLNIPSRVAPILAAESDPSRVTAILDKELKDALSELTRS